MKKENFPSTGALIVVIFLLSATSLFWGQIVPANSLFAKYFNSIQPLGGSLYFLIGLTIFFAVVFAVIFVIIKYDEWRNS